MTQDKESKAFENILKSDSRREFLKQMGVALGGVALTGGGAISPLFGQTPLPSGYNFYRVWTAGVPIINEIPNPVSSLGAAVMLGSFQAEGKPQSDVIYFHGRTTEKAHAGSPQALFRAQIDYSSPSKPLVKNLFTVVAEGDSLTQVDGVPRDQLPIVVGSLGIGSANSTAHYATTITVDDYGATNNENYSVPAKAAPGVYLLDPQFGWSKVARLGDTPPDSPDGTSYGGFFGDVHLNEDNTVDFVAATTDVPPPPGLGAAARRSSVPWTVATHALIHSSPENPGNSYIVLKTGDRLPGTAAVVESIGLFNAIHGELFVAQVNARRLDILNALPGTAVVRGRLQRGGGAAGPPNLDLLTGSPGLFKNGLPTDRDTLLGETFIGPRIGFGGLTAIVTHDSVSVPSGGSLDLQRLSTWGRQGRELIFRAGDVNADSASAMGGPVVSPTTGLTYVIRVLADGSTELVVFSQDGNEKVILRSGDVVQGYPITEILHGYHPAQVDPQGRLAFAAEFLTDPKNPQAAGSVISCLVIGIPI
jgi:hypothetical protein